MLCGGSRSTLATSLCDRRSPLGRRLRLKSLPLSAEPPDMGSDTESIMMNYESTFCKTSSIELLFFNNTFFTEFCEFLSIVSWMIFRENMKRRLAG
jgi:hypothetical protein